MIRSSSTSVDVKVEPAPDDKPISALEKLTRMVQHVSLSSSSIALNLSNYSSESATRLNEEAKKSSMTFATDCGLKSKSMTTLNTAGTGENGEAGELKPEDQKDFKLVSPYGDWCAFR